jgi:anaerobic nitric oxide reductase transcription regulator
VLKHLVHDDRDRRRAQLLGTSAVVKALRREIELVAQSDLTVLITGETGVGKELVAASIHATSRRSDEPLIQVNCAAMPESIAESELFGHVRGSFTGAIADRAGKFEIADGGTLFLDEIGELPLSIQAKLLRALQQGEIQRVGSDKVLKVDVRVIAATNRDLEAELAAGRFRPDLYHRLSVYPLHVAPLREHRDDIPLLAGHIFDRESLRLGVAGARLDADARQALMEYPWPGNVRELEHVLMRALLRACARSARESPSVIHVDHLGLGAQTPPAREASPAMSASDNATGLRHRIDAFTRSEIAGCMQRHHGVWAAAARELQLSPSNLQRVARRLGMGPGS